MSHPVRDWGDRSPEALARVFEHFGAFEAPQIDGDLYAELCPGVARDRELLALAGLAQETQPPPNMLFGAVHFLLLGGDDHPLRAYYPGLAAGPRPEAPPFPLFRDFCLERRRVLEGLIATRRTQTNVIQRCTALLPAFGWVTARAKERSLWLVEVGCSAGLNLLWDRHHYEYTAAGGPSVTWGSATAAVGLAAEQRGDAGLPALPASIPVARRFGIELDPIDLSDPDAVRWLKALIWPEHVERHARLAAAIGVWRDDPCEVRAGDASVLLPEALAAAPEEVALCVYGTHTLYQFPRDALLGVLRAMQTAGRERPVWFVGVEGHARDHSELRVTEYRDGGRETQHLADCSPHGRWIRPLPS